MISSLDEVCRLRQQKSMLHRIHFGGVALSIVLQIVCGMYQLLPAGIMVWWVVPLTLWCGVFLFLLTRIHCKIEKIVLQRKALREAYQDCDRS